MRLLISTRNRDKLREYTDLLCGLEIELVSLDVFPAVGPVEEDGDTLEANALKKAREAHRVTGLPAIGDDTGLEVRYLHDAPGVHSSRYAGHGATYADNVRKLLAELRGVPPRRRGARFRCVIAFVGGGGPPELAEGEVRGVITEVPRGEGGFGYDPVFLPLGQSQTFGEMDPSVKNAISHRAMASRAMRQILARWRRGG